MKTPSAILLFTLFLSVADSAEKSQTKAVPQPRVRLDPVSHAAVIVPVAENKTVPNTPVVLMDTFVVKGQSAIPKEPTHPEQQKDKFSVLNGGYVLKGDVGKAQWEIGAWPWLPWTDVMAADLKFKPAKTRVDLDIVRIHW